MLHFQRQIFFVVTAFVLPVAAPACADPRSLWDLNGSVVGLFADGPARVFRYEEPRQGLRHEGVRHGTLLFSGTQSGAAYSGTGYVFSRRCGAVPYPVAGTVTGDHRIRLYGSSPTALDDDCRPLAYQHDVNEFRLLEGIAAPQEPVEPARSQQPVAAAQQREEQRLAELRTEQEHLREERAQEERRLAELRIFSANREACRRYEAGACDRALASPHADPQDESNLRSWRAAAEEFAAVFEGCRHGSLAACDAALASAAGTHEQRQLVATWRTAASPTHRAKEFVFLQTASIVAAASDISTAVRNLPAPTTIATVTALALALLLAAMVWQRRRPNPAPSASRTVLTPPLPPQQTNVAGDAEPAGQRHAARSQLLADALATPDAAPPLPATAHTKQPEPQFSPAATRDTPGAIAALELAFAYLEEVREAGTPAFEDELTRRHHLNTLSLAAKQLERAAKLDPDAVLEGEDKDGLGYRFSVNELKAETLFLEGLTHHMYDTKRAIPALMRATGLNPNDPRPFYVLGLTHAANRNKSQAIAALQRAVALDPNNLSYLKELDRVQNLSGAEIAAYKTTRAGERIYDAGIATANAGIRAWNIFAILWNIATFPLRVLFAIFRLLRLHPFA